MLFFPSGRNQKNLKHQSIWNGELCDGQQNVAAAKKIEWMIVRLKKTIRCSWSRVAHVSPENEYPPLQ